MVGKHSIITRVVDNMTENLRPTRAEATDVANVVLDGTDGILLGAETLCGLYPIEAMTMVGRICAEVRVAIKVKASIIVVFTSLGGATRLITKYKSLVPM
ncbi:hypothetical protein REPUB_Repub02eG0099100 [Reevesia pubescens]